MSTLTEKYGPNSCVISEGEHGYSRDEVSVAAGAGVTLPGGTVLGRITATGVFVIWNPANTDGSQVVAAVLSSPVTGTQKSSVIRRLSQVNTSLLNWFSGATAPQRATGIAGLATLGIIAR